MMMFPLRPEHQLTAPPVKLVRALKTFMRVSGREYHKANSMIIQPAIRTSTLYLRNHPKGNIIETLDDDVLFRSGSPTQYRSSRKADLTSRFFYAVINSYALSIFCPYRETTPRKLRTPLPSQTGHAGVHVKCRHMMQKSVVRFW